MTVQPETAAPSPAKPAGLIKSSMIYSGLTLVSRFMGLARDLVITARLGASMTPAADTYNTALAFPNLFRRIFAEGAFAAAFVPAYTKTLGAEGADEADRIASDALATVATATLILTIAAQLAMPWLMLAINPGYVSDPAKFKLAVALTQVSMPYLPCMAIVALLSGVLNARNRFVLSAAAPTLLNGVMLIAVWPQNDPVQAARAASWAILAAGVLQAAWLWWGVRRTGARVRPVLPKLTPEIRTLIGLAIPGAIAASATQINVFISGILASQTPGARSWLAVCDRLYQLPIGLIAVAIGVALLPRLSMAIQVGEHKEADEAMDQALVFALALTLPAAAALIAMPFYLIDGLFTRGAFTSIDARATASALFHYGWGVPAFVLTRICAPAFFARGDTRAPMRFGLISVAVNIVLGITLFHLIGFSGIAAATATASWVTVVQMLTILARRGDYRLSAKALSRLGRILAASVAMGAVLAFASHERALIEAPIGGFHFAGLHAKEIAVLGVSGAGFLLYVALLFAFGGVTPAEVRQALKRRKGETAVVTPDLP